MRKAIISWSVFNDQRYEELNNMKIIFCAYRSWATEALEIVSRHNRIQKTILINTVGQLNKIDLKNFDLLITLGWSWELGKEITDNINAIGLHCAKLDRYSYGTPLQLQIIDGVVHSKHRIFPFISSETSERAHTHTRQYSHETDLYLHGDMKDIFEQLKYTSIGLLNTYLDDFPNIHYKTWPKEKDQREARTPDESRLPKDNISKMSSKEIYNFIRALGTPYPNAFIEDDEGKVFFEKVRFQAKK